MRRREFITLLGTLAVPGPVLWTAAVRAEVAAKLWRVGIILEGTRNRTIDGFSQGMHEFGHAEGKDYLADWRFANGRYTRFPDFAQDFVRLKADVIFVETAAAVEPVRQVTRAIPIVMGYSIDPVGSRLVASLARPGGNVTGMAGSREPAWPKQIELLRLAFPKLSRLGILLNPENSDYPELMMRFEAATNDAHAAPVFADARDPASLGLRSPGSPRSGPRQSSSATIRFSPHKARDLPSLPARIACRRSPASAIMSRPAGHETRVD